MNDGYFTSTLSRAVYRLALATRHLQLSRRSASFGSRNDNRIGRIFVINLDRATGRWNQLHRELTRFRDEEGEPLTRLTRRVSAVDARYPVELAPQKVEPHYTLADQLFVDPRVLPAGVGDPADISIQMSAEEVAVALSHVKTWELIAGGAHQYGLVLEDDVYFRRNFQRVFDRAWSEVVSTKGPDASDLLYVSYAEALGGTEWAEATRAIRRPVRGLWQLSGYVLSRHGARTLLDRLPVRGPVDLWINFAFTALDVVAVRRPAIKQRLDLPSSNFYSALPVLSKVGLISSDKAPSPDRPSIPGPIFGLGESGTGVTALAMALSMLGYRCCSDIRDLPGEELRALFQRARSRVFDAYVNIGTLDSTKILELATVYPESRIITTAATGSTPSQRTEGHQSARNNTVLEDVRSDALAALRSIDGNPSRFLVLPTDHGDKWQLLTEFLGCDYPSHRFPRAADQPQRNLRQVTHVSSCRRPEAERLRWDSLPWIAASDGWQGFPLAQSGSSPGEGTSTKYVLAEDGCWLLRDDTFPGNLALFSRANFANVGGGVARLTLRREQTPVRDYTSAAVSTRGSYRYGRFTADLMPAKASGLVTGMFLHRNSPRQEIDIEFLGKDTTKMLVNVYFNPGDDGTRLEYGYRGTPVLIDLGFDASAAFHRYDIEWTPQSVRWKVDGECVYVREQWNPTPIPHLPMQFHINLWHSRSAALAGRLAHRRLPAHSHLREVEINPTYQASP